ncbi:hypothetical protein V1478_002690 [Vespula squamosa]|uniref:Uncharacterized protein n=1 Tax=Vespula squamosa TaxID=30214 RepID=A0ABD2BTC1_VESSQ
MTHVPTNPDNNASVYTLSLTIPTTHGNMLSTILLGNTKAEHPSAADPCSCCDNTGRPRSYLSIGGHAARDADTIWGFTPEACDNITAMCRIYVPCVKHCSGECSCLPRRATMYYSSRLPPFHSARRLRKPDYSRGNASEVPAVYGWKARENPLKSRNLPKNV